MAMRRYEVSLQAFKNISCVSTANEWNIFQHEKRNFVSLSSHLMLDVYYHKHQWNTKPFHFNNFCCERRDLAIATLIFSCMKITCYFHMWRYRVFAWKLTWYFTGVYIINNHNYNHGCRRMKSVFHKVETSGVCLCEPFVSQMKVDFQQYISILYRSEIIKSRSTESVYQVSSHSIHLHVY